MVRAACGTADIDRLDQELQSKYKDRMTVDPSLERNLVTFKSSRSEPIYRWFKFKEAFSPGLVRMLLDRYSIRMGRLLDPFAGVGTSLFAARDLGLDADGIEVLPVAQEIVSGRAAVERLTKAQLSHLSWWIESEPWNHGKCSLPLNELRITLGAYPPDAARSIGGYMSAAQREDHVVQTALKLALISILESISYTRKDGQYLRWDNRSGRAPSSRPFMKRMILPFDEAVAGKLGEIVADVGGLSSSTPSPIPNVGGRIKLTAGSCLEVLPKVGSATYDVILTSPPYCNRQDYTRTYALELAMLGIKDQELMELRQSMLSCTVENKNKDLLSINPNWQRAMHVADSQELLQATLSYLHDQKIQRRYKTPGVPRLINGMPRMVRGYFYEMACVIAECARVLKQDGLLLMVNDNVRYAGASISVDLILSEMAEQLGLVVEEILVVPIRKWNSSQQMLEHGSAPLRKCVYVWRRA